MLKRWKYIWFNDENIFLEFYFVLTSEISSFIVNHISHINFFLRGTKKKSTM